MCVLRVCGQSFDVDTHLPASGLTAIKVWHAGEPRLRGTKPEERKTTSGFTIGVSDASWDSVDEQTEAALAFLAEHEQALVALRRAPGVEAMWLDFPVNLRIDSKTVLVQSDYFQPELVSRAGMLGLGIEISIYPKDLAELADALAADADDTDS